ncbi:hypothetical protein VTN49DRAFT_1312 [Thermomyces lanuginosus]|uniref:uncharacterized protein n=1 Tax=Thermomyces lanuginosus TaxID=5541 RepID=UPI003743ECF8
MQSGITVSPELHDAFSAFASDDSLFALPVTITSESLQPLQAIAFGASDRSFYASLPQLRSVLEPKTPLFLLLRHTGINSLIALSYIPSNAGVRAKTVFASTRATLVRELGSEKFAHNILVTEEEEVVGEEAWRERDLEGTGSQHRREDLMDEKERELEAVRRAEEEARHGAVRRDVGIGGSVSKSGGGTNVNLPVDDDAREALRSLRESVLVQLSIDISTETIKLASADADVPPDAVASKIPDSSPRYSYYHFPGSDVVLFIYTCPSGSSIKERMLYASTRHVAVTIGETEGLKLPKKVEESSPSELTEKRLRDEAFPPQDQGPKRGFARPKRPGR